MKINSNQWWIIAIQEELNSARKVWPSPDNLTGALAEESGEAVKEAMHFYNGESSANRDNLTIECIQTAAMAIRLAEEGDPLFNVPPMIEEI
jgi:hypothetical protein